MANDPQNYTVFDPNGVVVNIVLWDGDETKWTAEKAYGKGYTARPLQKGDVIPPSNSE